ncbi:MAG TPA: TonB-dependent receptor, partial [candidate division Zixibacteria bacterium]|nr:TonB-dependent receptor [candidate division Zixibacteria bacterium]
LYTYTDGGGALGYSSVRIRGFDDKRIAASLNGVPLNDPEDQAAYFVDLPDFAANITDIQVQRGVGNALYGAASFGGSLNIVTGALSRDRRVTVTSGYGEYTSGGDRVSDLAKSSIEYVSGLIDGRWLFTGRFSDQRSGGYRRHSWYDGWSYYLSLARLDPRMTTELYLYGGPIRMHLAYYGVDRATLAVDRRANPLTYRNETDNFNQPHFHLHNTYQLSERATLATTLYYIQGEGYYEQLKQLEDPDDFAVYGLDPGELAVDQPRLVRQKWVDKRQWGWNPRLDLAHARGRHSIGGSAYYFTSDHWGQVVWVEGLEDRSYGPRQRYYRYEGRKVEANLFAQEYCRLTDRLAGEATAMLRYQRYDFDQTRMYSFRGFRYDVDWLFFSPRLGFTYTLAPEIALHTAFAVSSRTPTDEDIYEADDPFALPSLDIRSVSADSARWEFGDPTAKAERVYDFELGGGYRSDRYAVELALYWMEFRDEIIPEGAVDASGRRRTINADRSVHAGLELSGTARPTEALALSGNFAWAYNRIRDYTASLDLYDTDWNYAGQYRFDLADKTVPGFPAYLGNVLLDYRYRGLRAVWRHQFVGAQELDLANTDSLRIEPFQLASVSLSYRFSDFWHLGALTLTARVNNVFDRRYEAGGYGWNYAVAGDGGTDVLGGAEYFAAPERWYYGEVKLEIF